MDVEVPDALLYSLFTTIMTLIVFGNSLVIIAIQTERGLLTASNIFISSLAVADLTVGLFIIPLQMRETATGGSYQHWHYGRTLCLIWLTMDIILVSTTILHICAIAIDRYRCIHEGYSYISRRTLKGSIYLCICLWLFAIWIGCEPVLGWNDWVDLPDTECTLPKNWGFIVHVTIGGFFAPSSVTCVLYIKIFFKIKQTLKDHLKLTNGTDMELVGCTTATITMKSEDKIALKERKAAKTLGCIICAFGICWLPFMTTILVYGFAGDEYVNINFYRFSIWFGYTNSALNPLIYSVSNHRFRCAFKKLLKISSSSVVV